MMHGITISRVEPCGTLLARISSIEQGCAVNGVWLTTGGGGCVCVAGVDVVDVRRVQVVGVEAVEALVLAVRYELLQWRQWILANNTTKNGSCGNARSRAWCCRCPNFPSFVRSIVKQSVQSNGYYCGNWVARKRWSWLRMAICGLTRTWSWICELEFGISRSKWCVGTGRTSARGNARKWCPREDFFRGGGPVPCPRLRWVWWQKVVVEETAFEILARWWKMTKVLILSLAGPSFHLAYPPVHRSWSA